MVLHFPVTYRKNARSRYVPENARNLCVLSALYTLCRGPHGGMRANPTRVLPWASLVTVRRRLVWRYGDRSALRCGSCCDVFFLQAVRVGQRVSEQHGDGGHGSVVHWPELEMARLVFLVAGASDERQTGAVVCRDSLPFLRRADQSPAGSIPFSRRQRDPQARAA